MKKRQQLEVGKSLTMLAKTSFIVFVGLILSKLLTYVYRVVAARVFGPEAYGMFSLAIVVSGWFIAVATLGLSEGLLRYLAIYRGQNNTTKASYLFRTSFALLCLTGIIAGAIMFIFAEKIALGVFHEPGLTVFLQLFSLAVPLTVLATPALMGIRAFEYIGAYSGIFNILQNVVKVFMLVVLFLVGMGTQAISLSYLAGLAVVVAAAYWYASRKIGVLFVKTSLNNNDKSAIRKEVWSYSWPLMFYGILVTILYWIDSFSIGYFKDAAAVGMYNAAVPIALLLSIAPELFTQLFLPMINRYYAERKVAVIRELSKQVTKWVLAINLPVFVIMAVFPEVLINLLFGSQYLAAATALRILAISGLISSLGFIAMHLVSMTGKSRLVMMNILIAGVLNFILNAIFVPMPTIGFLDNASGINGAALGTLISITVFNALFFVQTYKYTKIFPLRRKMFQVVLALLPSTILALFIDSYTNNNLPAIILMAIVFVGLYLILLFAFKAFDKHDKEILLKIKGTFRRIISS